MNVKEVADNIGYCGSMCKLCHNAERCGGCKSSENSFGRCLSAVGCYQYNCCVSKGIAGCWNCDIAPCEADMFGEEHNLRNRVFVKVARQEGLLKLAEYVLRNQENGILYGWNKDYDELGNEDAIIDLLHNGKPCDRH